MEDWGGFCACVLKGESVMVMSGFENGFGRMLGYCGGAGLAKEAA